MEHSVLDATAGLQYVCCGFCQESSSFSIVFLILHSRMLEAVVAHSRQPELAPTAYDCMFEVVFFPLFSAHVFIHTF